MSDLCFSPLWSTVIKQLGKGLIHMFWVVGIGNNWLSGQVQMHGSKCSRDEAVSMPAMGNRGRYYASALQQQVRCSSKVASGVVTKPWCPHMRGHAKFSTTFRDVFITGQALHAC